MGFSVMIKPASSQCNLLCRYCYYNNIAERRSVKSLGMMSFQTIENIMRKTFAHTNDEVNFLFQGGEPLLVGMDFYIEFMRLLKLYNSANIKVKLIIQSNGTLITDKWAQFFVENDFLVGVTLDGPQLIHNAMRIKSNGKGSFLDVIKGIDILKKWNIDFHVMCVINELVSQNTKSIYNFFKSQNIKHLQFIPYHDPIDEISGGYPHSLKPVSFGKFMCELFDLWYSDLKKNCYLSIRNFDNYVRMAHGENPEVCSMLGHCVPYFVIEANGQVYPCDFYSNDSWYLGNINDTNFKRLTNSPLFKKFVDLSIPKDAECLNCEHYKLCRSGCRRNREPFIE